MHMLPPADKRLHAERFHFLSSKLAVFTTFELAETQRPDRDSYQFQDIHIERCQEPSDVPILAFVQHYFDPAVAISNL